MVEQHALKHEQERADNTYTTTRHPQLHKQDYAPENQAEQRQVGWKNGPVADATRMEAANQPSIQPTDQLASQPTNQLTNQLAH